MPRTFATSAAHSAPLGLRFSTGETALNRIRLHGALALALAMTAALPLAAPAADAPVHATEATQAADAAFRAIYEKEWAWRASAFGFAADEDEKGDADMPRLDRKSTRLNSSH